MSEPSFFFTDVEDAVMWSRMVRAPNAPQIISSLEEEWHPGGAIPQWVLDEERASRLRAATKAKAAVLANAIRAVFG